MSKNIFDFNFNNWISIDYLDDKNKAMVKSYFPNNDGKFKIENNILLVDLNNWGIEKFYLSDTNNSKKFYTIEYSNFKKIHSMAISIQIGNWTTFKKMEHYLQNFKNIYVNIYITIIDEVATQENINSLKNYSDIVILKCENRGMDIGLFLITLHYIKSQKYNHEYLYKIHTKTQDNFRNDTISNLMGNHEKIINNIKLLSNKNIGMISGNVIFRYHENRDIFHSNLYHLENIVSKIYNEKIQHNNLEFPAATFFIAKYKIFQSLTAEKIKELYFSLNNAETLDYYWYSMFYNLNINNKANIYKDYINNANSRFCNNINYQKRTNKQGLRDCMIEHAFERFFGYMCKKNGLDIVKNQ